MGLIGSDEKRRCREPLFATLAQPVAQAGPGKLEALPVLPSNVATAGWPWADENLVLTQCFRSDELSTFCFGGESV